MSEKIPYFLKAYYESLQKSSDEKNVLENALKIFVDASMFIGKMHLLEYAHQEAKDKAINYYIFTYLTNNEVVSWIELIKKLRLWWQINSITPQFLVTESFAPLFQDENDIIDRLLWFYKVALLPTEMYLTSPSDAGECKDASLSLLEYFSFFDTVSYEIKNKESFLVHENRSIALSPFYSLKLQGSSGLQLHADESENIVKIYAREWLSQDFALYQQEKKGHIEFDTCNSISIMPWIEANIRDSLAQLFALPRDMNSKRMCIQGYPATGKTTICKNIKEIICNDCDFVLQYFVVSDSVYQDSATFKLWFYRSLKKVFGIDSKLIEKSADQLQVASGFFELQNYLAENNVKIVCCIDGIDYMPQKEFLRLYSFVVEDLFNGISFIFFRRLFSKNDIDCMHRITIHPVDNVMYDEIFDICYAKKIADYYLESKTKQDIFNYLVNHQEAMFTIQELSDALEIHTHLVLKSIEEMMPLLKKEKNSYQLFHKLMECHHAT